MAAALALSTFVVVFMVQSEGHPAPQRLHVTGLQQQVRHGLEFVKNATTTVDSISDSSADGNCTASARSATIYKHRSVEVIGASRDAYGSWVYPY